MSKTYVPSELRKQVEERAKHHCEYCLLPNDFSNSVFWIDHILPESKGGLTVVENLANACSHCNGNKWTKTLGFDDFLNQNAPIFNPRTEKWKDHFLFNENKTIIIGTTSTGRATINQLKMNEKRLQNLRAALRDYGVFPPDFF